MFDEDYQAPYSYGGNQWASYDNPKSVAIKVVYWGGLIVCR